MTVRSDLQAQVLVPIGGGYQQLSGFAEAVIDAAPGPVARVAVVPAASGNDPADPLGRAALAESVALVGEALNEAAAAGPRVKEVETVLVEAYEPGDADRPECTAAVAEHRTDGVFLLGGDQARAMQALAGSALEEAIVAACAKGAVIGGTSAGAAVQSVTMLAGFTMVLKPWKWSDGMDRLVNNTEYGSISSGFYQYEDYAARQLPWLWLPDASSVYVYKKNLSGVFPSNPFTATLNPEGWYYTRSAS